MASAAVNPFFVAEFQSNKALFFSCEVDSLEHQAFSLRNPYLFYCCGRTQVKALFSTNGDLQQFGNSLVGKKSVGVDYGTVKTGIAVSR